MIWKWFCLAAAFAAGISVSGCQRGPSAAQVSNGIGSTGIFAGGASENATSEWMRVDRPHQRVELKVVYGVNGSRNVDGYRNGTLNFVVPTGWTVDVTFMNAIRGERHSAVIAPFAEHNLGAVQPAFAGAHTPNPSVGIDLGKTQQFSFTANKDGRYAIVCGVRGHRSLDAGMWATFVAAPNTLTPRIYIQHES